MDHSIQGGLWPTDSSAQQFLLPQHSSPFPPVLLDQTRGMHTLNRVPVSTQNHSVDSCPGPVSRPLRIPLQSAWPCKHLRRKPYRPLGVYTGVVLLLGCIVILLCRDDGSGDVVMVVAMTPVAIINRKTHQESPEKR